MPKKISRRLQELRKKVEERPYEPKEALQLLKETATAKFLEAAEAHVRLGIDPKYTDQQLRTTVALPKGTGQTIRIAVIAKGEKDILEVTIVSSDGGAMAAATRGTESSRSLGDYWAVRRKHNQELPQFGQWARSPQENAFTGSKAHGSK